MENRTGTPDRRSPPGPTAQQQVNALTEKVESLRAAVDTASASLVESQAEVIRLTALNERTEAALRLVQGDYLGARGEALREAAALCVSLVEKHDIHSNFICANAIRALASSVPVKVQESPSELAEMEARKDAAYYERNQVVAALAKCFPSGTTTTDIPEWDKHWHGCVRIDLPTGQISWHFHDDHAHLFADLPPYAGEWDGHDSPEKYRRLASLARPAAGVQVAPDGFKWVPLEPTEEMIEAGSDDHGDNDWRHEPDARPPTRSDIFVSAYKAMLAAAPALSERAPQSVRDELRDTVAELVSTQRQLAEARAIGAGSVGDDPKLDKLLRDWFSAVESGIFSHEARRKKLNDYIDSLLSVARKAAPGVLTTEMVRSLADDIDWSGVHLDYVAQEAFAAVIQKAIAGQSGKDGEPK